MSCQKSSINKNVCVFVCLNSVNRRHECLAMMHNWNNNDSDFDKRMSKVFRWDVDRESYTVLVFQCMTGQESSSSLTSAHAYSARPRQRCAPLNARIQHFRRPCFATAGPRVWNNLPAHLRQCDSLGQFKRLLKTHLFGVWDCVVLWCFLLRAPSRNHFTYLLTLWLKITSNNIIHFHL